jgi:hypothetical protein
VQFTNVDGDSRGVGRVTLGFIQTMAIVIAQGAASPLALDPVTG